MLAQEGSYVRKRGGFATKHVWVTAFDPDEKYASGDYPNVHAGGDGLPRYVAQNRNIENTDHRACGTPSATPMSASPRIFRSCRSNMPASC